MHGEAEMAERQNTGRVGRAIIAGFVALGVATVMLVIVSGVAGALGEVYREQGLIFQWMYELTHNPLVELGRVSVFPALALHMIFGIVWAVLYAVAFEPRLRQYSGWQAGAVFSLLPFILSVFVFLPLSGGGFMGAELRAGPLPILGNLILHLLFGATLGAGYAADRYTPMDDLDDVEVDALAQRTAMRRSETDAARGIVMGVVFGGILGAIMGRVLPFSAPEDLVGSWEVALGVAGALVGGAVGALVGSMAGLTGADAEVVEAPPSAGQPISAALLPLVAMIIVAILIVSIGSALLTAAGDPHLIEQVEPGAFMNPYYAGPIYLGLAILTVIVGGAAALDKWLPRSDEDQHH